MKVWEFMNVLDMSSVDFLTITNKKENICCTYDSEMDDLNKVKETCSVSKYEVEKVTIVPDRDGEWLKLIIMIK